MPLAGPVISGVTSGGVEVPLRVNTSGQLELSQLALNGATSAVKTGNSSFSAGDPGTAILGVRPASPPTARISQASYYGPMALDIEGKIIVSGSFAAPENTKQAYVNYTATTDLQLFPASGSGLRTYITDLTVENTGASASRFFLRDGLVTIWSATVPAGTTLCETWETPLRLSVNTVVNGQLGAAGTVTVQSSGYTGL